MHRAQDQRSFLAIGAIVLIAAGWLFVGVAEDIVRGDPLTIIDVELSQWLHANAATPVTRWMQAITSLHGVVAIGVYVTLISAYLAWKRSWYWLLCLSVTVTSGMVVNTLIKLVFQRARPTFDHPLLVLSTYSFPSGHVAGATLFYGVLGAMLLARRDAWRWRVPIAFGYLAVVGLVAFTRLYLGVHYLSDVIAAFAGALAWLTLCLMAIDAFWRHRLR